MFLCSFSLAKTRSTGYSCRALCLFGLCLNSDIEDTAVYSVSSLICPKLSCRRLMAVMALPPGMLKKASTNKRCSVLLSLWTPTPSKHETRT